MRRQGERRWSRPALLGCALLLASAGIATAVGALRQEGAAETQEPAPAAQRDLRGRTQPGVWDRGPLRKFRLVTDREAARAESIRDRASRRAYHGAPPVMPHTAVFGGSIKQCVGCHAQGMALGDRVAHPMSHPPMPNCLQCHVESANRMFEPGPSPATRFEGLPSPGPGPRQGPEAPPQIPHSIALRGLCIACHGEFGYPGIRTDHPLRANCVQCHVQADGAF